MVEAYRPFRRRLLSLGATALISVGGCLRLTEEQQPDESSRSEQGEDDSNRPESESSGEAPTAEPVTNVSLTESWRYEGVAAEISEFVPLDDGFFAKHWNIDSPQSLLRFESDGADSWESEPISEGYRFRSRLWNVIVADSDTVYAGTRSLDEAEIGEDQQPGTGARLYAFDRADGTVQWYDEADVEFRDRVGHVALLGDVVIYTADGPTRADRSPVLRGIDRATGERLWSESLPGSVAGLTTVEANLVVATDQNVSVYEPQSGDRSNRFDVTPPESTEEDFLVGSAGTAYTYDRAQSAVVALDIPSREIRWDAPFGPELAGLCVGGSTVVLEGRDGIIAAYAVDTGERRWTTEVESTSSMPPHTQTNIVWIDGTGTVSAISEIGGEVIHEREFDDDQPQEIATHEETIVFSNEAVAYTVDTS